MSISAYMIGNLTRDPEVRDINTPNGIVKVCNFTIACSDRNLPRNNDSTVHTEFVRVAAWRGLANICSQYLKKGRKVMVHGAVRLHSYLDGNGEKQSYIEFPNVAEVEMIDSAQQTQTAQTAVAAQPATATQPTVAPNYDAPAAAYTPADNGFAQVDDDELPF